jgi:hypothetical protein
LINRDRFFPVIFDLPIEYCLTQELTCPLSRTIVASCQASERQNQLCGTDSRVRPLTEHLADSFDGGTDNSFFSVPPIGARTVGGRIGCKARYLRCGEIRADCLM